MILSGIQLQHYLNITPRTEKQPRGISTGLHFIV